MGAVFDTKLRTWTILITCSIVYTMLFKLENTTFESVWYFLRLSRHKKGTLFFIYMYVYNMYIFTAVVENKKRYGSKSAFGQKTFGEVQTNIYIYTRGWRPQHYTARTYLMDYNGNLRGYNIWVVPPDDAYRLSFIVRAVNVFLDSISIQCHDNILYLTYKTYTQ